MAENKLEGFEDLDNVLGEAEGEAGAGGQDFAGELDDLLGGGESGGEEGAAEGAGGESDSELDSFFEDLSTIDDLEVLQEEEEPSAEAAPEPELPAPEEEEEEAVEAAPAQPAARAAEPPPRERPRVPARPRRRKRGVLGRLVRWLVLLAVLGVGGYFVYNFFFPNLKPPWQVIQQKTKLLSELQKPTLPPPPPPPPVVTRPAPRPKPPPRRPAPPREHGPWSIQVATCFFPSCVVAYRDYLHGQKRSVLVRDKVSKTRSLEIFSQSTWDDHQEAQTLADRINKQHPMEGHAFVLREGGGYRISMGAFSDLARANVVKDALNQQYLGQIAFATRVRSFPYKVQSVLTGRYPTRARAEAALAGLKDAEPRLHDAFVTRNR